MTKNKTSIFNIETIEMIKNFKWTKTHNSKKLRFFGFIVKSDWDKRQNFKLQFNSEVFFPIIFSENFTEYIIISIIIIVWNWKSLWAKRTFFSSSFFSPQVFVLTPFHDDEPQNHCLCHWFCSFHLYNWIHLRSKGNVKMKRRQKMTNTTCFPSWTSSWTTW